MPKTTLSTLLFLSLCLCCAAQKQGQPLLDSLCALLPQSAEDTNKVKLLNKISNTYVYINTEEGLKYGRTALELAQRQSWSRGIADAYATIGSNYANKANYADALDYEYRALKIYEELSDKSKQAIMLRNIAIVYHRSKNRAKALEYNVASLQIYESLNDKEGIASIYNNTANVYSAMGNREKTLEYNNKALHMYETMKDLKGVARLTGNIGNLYADGREYSKAMQYYFDALQQETALGNKLAVMRNMGNIGETYLDIAKSPAGEVKPDKFIPVGKQAMLNKAIYYLKSTVENAKAMEQTEYVLAYAETLSEAYRLSGNDHQALEVYKAYVALRDSVFNVEKANALVRKELEYEYGKREDSITFQKQLADVKLADEQKWRSREKIFYTCGIGLVLLFSAFMFNRWRVSQQQKRIIEREKKRSDELLLNILPAETAEELKATGTARAKDFEEVTVMFTDFKNFTALSEKLEAQELVNDLHYCFSAFDDIIGKYRVEKIKTIGDSYMCAGGLPVPNQTHAEDMVKAAIEIHNFVQQETEKRKAVGKTFFEMRIGIHTGPVVAGIVGTQKFAYDIWGDTVNIAARMESSGEVGKINISETTYALVKNQFSCTHRGKVEAKNKGEIDMYFLEA